MNGVEDKKRVDMVQVVSSQWPLWFYAMLLAGLIYFVCIVAIGIGINELAPGIAHTAAEIGDSFGVLNAVISGLALLGAVYAVLLQRRELELQRRELRLARREAKRSADAHEKSSIVMDRQIKLLEEGSRHEKQKHLRTLQEWFSSPEMLKKKGLAKRFQSTFFGIGILEQDVADKHYRGFIRVLNGLRENFDEFLHISKKTYKSTHNAEPYEDMTAFLELASAFQIVAEAYLEDKKIPPNAYWFCESRLFLPYFRQMHQVCLQMKKENPGYPVVIPFDGNVLDRFWDYVWHLYGVSAEDLIKHHCPVPSK